jgi:hypothetical protein
MGRVISDRIDYGAAEHVTRAVVAKPNFGGQAWRKIRAISPAATP